MRFPPQGFPITPAYHLQVYMSRPKVLPTEGQFLETALHAMSCCPRLGNNQYDILPSIMKYNLCITLLKIHNIDDSWYVIFNSIEIMEVFNCVR